MNINKHKSADDILSDIIVIAFTYPDHIINRVQIYIFQVETCQKKQANINLKLDEAIYQKGVTKDYTW